MIDPFYGDTEISNISGETEASTVNTQVNPQDAGEQQEEPQESIKSAEKNKDEILQKLENAFAQLTSADDLETYLALHSRMRVMVSIEKLLELSSDKCKMEVGGKVCDEGLHVTQDVKICGSRV